MDGKRYWMLLLAGMLLVGVASAWGPNTHMFIIDTVSSVCSARPECNTSIIQQTIASHPDAFRCGMMFPDVTVLYYYIHFQSYEATHSYSFCEKALQLAKNDDEKAAAYGCYAHLVADTESHNYFIPQRIDDTHIPNDIIHPLVEALVESNYVDNLHTAHSMDSVDLYLPLFNRAGGFNMTEEAHLLRYAIGGQSFYSTQYTVPEDTLMLKIWKGVGGLIIKLNLVTKETGKTYILETVGSTYTYVQTGNYPMLDPTGAQKLDIVGSRSRMGMYTMLIGIPILMALGYLIVRKLRRRQPP